MLEALGIVSMVLLVVVVVLLLALLLRERRVSLGASLRQLERAQERSERLLREEMERGREETQAGALSRSAKRSRAS